VSSPASESQGGARRPGPDGTAARADRGSRERRAIADFRGSSSAPAWSNGDNPRRISTSRAIGTEGKFSADDRWLYFTSDRGGSMAGWTVLGNLTLTVGLGFNPQAAS